jgi:Spy/CpxP family protein refolding chaperone
MMRILIAAMCLVVAALVCPGLWAVDQAKDSGAGAGLAERMQDLNLTDAQEAKIADIRKEYRPKVQEAAKNLETLIKEEVEKARGVLTEEQKTKLAGLKEERKELRAERLSERIAHLEALDLTDAEMAKIAAIREEYRPKIVKAMENLRGLLTADQRMTREEALKAGKKRREIIASLNLTAEQKEKIEVVGKELRAFVREEVEKTRDVLTEAQKEKLEEFKDERKERVRDRMAHAIMNFKDLNLSADQKTKLAEIRKEYRPKIHEAGNKLRAVVREEMEAIVSVLKG